MSDNFDMLENARLFDSGEEEEVAVESMESSKKFLTFMSDGLHFAIDTDYVIEIINDFSITHLPKTPSFIKGIINLRGQIVPIMDARLRMNRSEVEYGREACVIVISVDNVSVGLLVETIQQMIDVLETQVSPPPVNNQQEFVSGIVRINGIVYLILDCPLLLDNRQ